MSHILKIQISEDAWAEENTPYMLSAAHVAYLGGKELGRVTRIDGPPGYGGKDQFYGTFMGLPTPRENGRVKYVDTIEEAKANVERLVLILFHKCITVSVDD